MSILITGAGGFVGRALCPLLLEKGELVYGLFRKPPEGHIPFNFIPLLGDITKPSNLGLKVVPKDIDRVYHLAGVHALSKEDKDGLIWRTNVVGTGNVLDFCVRHGKPHLLFTSTAYTWQCNPYGRSKIDNEQAITEYSRRYGLKATIFKPSIIMGTRGYPYPGHFSQFISSVIKIHQRAELVRRKIEGTLRLPVLEPVFRIKGNPSGMLNLVPVDAVAKAMAEIDKEGTFWLTNPNPATLAELAQWAGEFIMVRMSFERDFKPTPLEAMFQKMATAFEPYLEGDNFPSDLRDCPPITREFIHETIKQSALLEI